MDPRPMVQATSDERGTSPWQQRVRDELDGLYQLQGVTHTILVRRDGLPLAAQPPGRPEEKRLAAMIAAVRGTAEIATDEATGGRFTEALLRSDRSEIFCVSVGEDLVLGIVAEKGALTGLLFMAVQTAAERIFEALKDTERKAAES